MTLSIIGPGFGRTGTKSLKIALEKLGVGRCHHMHEVRDNPSLLPAWEALADGAIPDWDQVFEGFTAQVDWPGAFYWREIAAHYPLAKIVLTVRDPDLWYDSLSKTIIPFIAGAGSHPAEHPNRIAAWGEKVLSQKLFGGQMGNRRHAIKVYSEHIEDVRRTFPPSRLLVFDVADGWEPLCSFLKVENTIRKLSA